MGPLPTGESLLVVVDYYSRYFEIEVMQTTTTEKVINVHGYPFSLKSDNGRQFQSEEFRTFLVEHGIEHRTSPPLLPHANGEVERQNIEHLHRYGHMPMARWNDKTGRS